MERKKTAFLHAHAVQLLLWTWYPADYNEMELAHEKELARKEGRREGIKEGGRMMLISQVGAGIGKGLNSAAIADRLMTEEDSIRPIYDMILAKPEASPEEILQALKQQDLKQ